MRTIDKITEWFRECTGIKADFNAPKNPNFGDYMSNVAFTMDGNPNENAMLLLKKLKEKPSFVDRVETKGGFINIFLSKKELLEVIEKIKKEGSLFGSYNKGKGRKILIEFVSANPTGPLEVPNGRAAAIGDCLYRVFSFMGYSVDKEYYIDDCGRQVKLLGQSVISRMKGEEVPEGGYKGDYITLLAEDAKLKGPKNPAEFAVEHMIELQRKTLNNFGVEFTNWTRESEIRKMCPAVIETLKNKNMVYEKDGALWFKASEFGDEKDRVLVKSDGEYTYLTPDIAYHINKFERGYDILIDILGPDHLGHIPPLKGALKVLGYPSLNLRVLISQWVTIVEGGKKKRMSKREGRFITLDEIIEEIGKDVTKFIFLTRKRDSHLVFDMDAAKRESKENPVYYIQYAYARLSSIKRVAEERGLRDDFSKIHLLGEGEEIAILRKVIHFTEVIENVEKTMEPNLIPTYLSELASLFHTFYERHRVVGDDKDLSKARLSLVGSVRNVFGIGLSLLGITAPERM